jgi:hypothetical protein
MRPSGRGTDRELVDRSMRVVLLLAIGLIGCRPPVYGKEPTVDAAGPTVDASMSTTDAGPDATTAATCDHAFRLDGHGTDSSVWLTGSFINWAGTPQAGAIEFTLGNDGGWTGNYAFPAGSHQYKYIVSGNNWILDPTNPDTVDDGMGHTNSLYVCVP